MKFEDAAFWTLAAIGIPSVVVGAYFTGQSGEVHVLLFSGLAATTMVPILHRERSSEDEAGPADGGSD